LIVKIRFWLSGRFVVPGFHDSLAWQASAWPGRLRGKDYAERLKLIRSAARSLDGKFEWLRPPILNRKTRLALVADASSGTVVAQGYESGEAATAVLQVKAKGR
jgi:hypothetical protein